MKQSQAFLVLFIATLITAGGSIAFLTYSVSQTERPAHATYPVATNAMSNEYALLARNIVDQGIFSRSTTTPYMPDAWRTPGYPTFLAPFYLVFGSFYPVLIAQMGILFITVCLLYRMGVALVGKRYALALSLLYLILPGTLFAVSTLLTENLFTFLLVAAVYVAFFAPLKRLYVQFALAGILLGLGAYVRPAGLYIAPFFVAGYLVFYVGLRHLRPRHLIASGVFLLAFICTLLPWCYRNEVRLGHFTFATTGSYVLFRQNAVQFYEAMHDLPNLEARYALEDMAGIPRGPVPEGPEYSEVMKHVAIEVITSRPLDYAFFHLTTFIPYFSASAAIIYERYWHDLTPGFNPPEEETLLQAIHPWSWPKVWTVVQNHGWTLVENAGWAFASFLFFLSFFWSNDRRMTRMLLVLVFYFALVTGPISQARYRIPTDPLILLGAFTTVAYLVENRKNLRALRPKFFA
jgi:4-amino-4-deoxy-L-arabinose transferase-like glycosyltransferase